MKTKTLKAYLSILVAFSLALSSCDKKNALLVNRRTATPAPNPTPADADAAIQGLVNTIPGLSALGHQRLFDVLKALRNVNDRHCLINVLYALPADDDNRSDLINVLIVLAPADRIRLINILHALHDHIACIRLINILHDYCFDGSHHSLNGQATCTQLIDVLTDILHDFPIDKLSLFIGDFNAIARNKLSIFLAAVAGLSPGNRQARFIELAAINDDVIRRLRISNNN